MALRAPDGRKDHLETGGRHNSKAAAALSLAIGMAAMTTSDAAKAAYEVQDPVPFKSDLAGKTYVTSSETDTKYYAINDSSGNFKPYIIENGISQPIINADFSGDDVQDFTPCVDGNAYRITQLGVEKASFQGNTVKGPWEIFSILDGAGGSIAIACEGGNFYVASKNFDLNSVPKIAVFDLAAGQYLGLTDCDIPGSSGTITGISFTPDGKEIKVAISTDQFAKVRAMYAPFSGGNCTAPLQDENDRPGSSTKINVAGTHTFGIVTTPSGHNIISRDDGVFIAYAKGQGGQGGAGGAGGQAPDAGVGGAGGNTPDAGQGGADAGITTGTGGAGGATTTTETGGNGGAGGATTTTETGGNGGAGGATTTTETGGNGGAGGAPTTTTTQLGECFAEAKVHPEMVIATAKCDEKSTKFEADVDASKGFEIDLGNSQNLKCKNGPVNKGHVVIENPGVIQLDQAISCEVSEPSEATPQEKKFILAYKIKDNDGIEHGVGLGAEDSVSGVDFNSGFTDPTKGQYIGIAYSREGKTSLYNLKGCGDFVTKRTFGCEPLTITQDGQNVGNTITAKGAINNVLINVMKAEAHIDENVKQVEPEKNPNQAPSDSESCTVSGKIGVEEHQNSFGAAALLAAGLLIAARKRSAKVAY